MDPSKDLALTHHSVRVPTDREKEKSIAVAAPRLALLLLPALASETGPCWVLADVVFVVLDEILFVPLMASPRRTGIRIIRCS
ncbi:hypothetical protein ABZP36_029783 [Zizania latifolia]